MLDIENKILFDEPMKKHTSFKIGGNADFFVSVNNEEELMLAIKYAKTKKIPITIIGNGSNILVTDKGIKGLVIKINIDYIKIDKINNNAIITVGAGTKIMALGYKLAEEGITGFEEISGVPGTIGGAIYMNAGAYGKEIKDIVVSTRCIDFEGNIYDYTNEEQEFEYRKSIFNRNDKIILSTKLKLEYEKIDIIKQKMKELFETRKEKQPLEFHSAGSTFKRMDGFITAKLIDECGLKGYSIGGAKVSEKHAGFVVNFNDATAKDVIELIKYVKEKVYEKKGIKIEEEIKIIGEQ